MKVLDQALHRRVLHSWRRALRAVPDLSRAELRRVQGRAQALAPLLAEARAVAEGRLAVAAAGPATLPRPHGTDWAWRPDAWGRPLPVPGRVALAPGTRLADGLTLFHDGARPELALRQARNTRDGDIAPFGMVMDVFTFDGDFLSLVIDLPEAAMDGLDGDRLVQLDTHIETESPLRIFARLNIRHGPNTARILREIPADAAQSTVEFDLGYAGLNEKRITQGWLDLIFEAPRMNRVALRDVTLCRRRRAAL